MRFWAFLAAIAVVGCARFPTGGGGTFTKRLHFRVRLAGPVNPNYVFIAAINDADDLTGANGGPIPVVQRPWGNGFVAGKCTHFIRYDGTLPNGGYGVFKFTDLINLLTWFQTGIPVNFITPNPGSDIIEFEIDLTQIRPLPSDALLIQALQINLLTMDRVPTNPDDPNPRYWDAFGDGTPGSINDFITIDVTTAHIYRNSDLNIEPGGDVADPSLDIVDWSIEIRTQ
jgi:hypothetical protein